ncbi:MAG: lipoate--protein ligase [Candidatus Helarchaeota archaeon]
MTDTWRLLKLGGIDPLESQMVYEAVAIARDRGIVPDTIIFCWPKDPIVCIGFHQELLKEIDYDYCQNSGIPVVRRILGGGAVYLDAGQLFYQIIASEENPAIPHTMNKLFEKLLQAPLWTYQDIGIAAEYKPINDIQVNGRKISGNGVGKLGKISILTGNLIVDFNFDQMVKILKVPSEKFRDKLASTLRERLSTIKRELGVDYNKDRLMELLEKNFAKVFDRNLHEGTLLSAEYAILSELREKYLSHEWLFLNSLRHPELTQKSQSLSQVERVVKVAGGIYICEGVFKAEGGLIRVTLELHDGLIEDVLISGDFEFFPKDKLADLEKALIGLRPTKDTLNATIENFYQNQKIQAPGTHPQDFTKTILLAQESL